MDEKEERLYLNIDVEDNTIMQQLDVIMIPWMILSSDSDASVKENLIKP